MFGQDGWHGIGWMGAGMWIFWILLIVVIVVLVKGLTGRAPDSPAGRHETPLEILKARYARGEISDEEFRHLRDELEK